MLKLKLILIAAIAVYCAAIVFGVGLMIRSHRSARALQPATAPLTETGTLSSAPTSQRSVQSPQRETPVVPAKRPRPVDPQQIIANRAICAENLQYIRDALLFYANDHRGEFPADLGTLVAEVDVDLERLLCPNSGGPVLKRAGMSSKALADWMNANGDYRMVPGSNASADATTVILHENDRNEFGEGINVLFGDGRCVFLPLDEAHTAITRSIQKLAARRSETR
jgi:hypothetical protein